ncbi:MAG: dioxygenase, partial [Synergistales bacterium]|nr:dioxygenase [Synergistales bacterium]
NRYSRFLSGYAKKIPRPAAIVVISAHWQTRGTFITSGRNPQQIYDFGGFPDDLYSVGYAPDGSPETAARMANAGLGVSEDPDRGIDHAAWAVIRHMYPAKDVPLLEMSLDVNKPEEEDFEMGKRLAKLGQNGILFMGSGNMVHNLRNISFEEKQKPFPWAVKADLWLKEAIENHEVEKLIYYREKMPEYRMSIPTDEHFLPLLYIMGMRAEEQSAGTIYEEIQNGSISMRCIEIG